MKVFKFLLLSLGLFSCYRNDQFIKNFESTEANELAKIIHSGKLDRIKQTVKENPGLMSVTDPKYGENALVLALNLANYDVFELLIQEGADPNFINPLSKYSVLMTACEFYDSPQSFPNDPRYVKLLLNNGADPNYALENWHTDITGNSHMPGSPLIIASRFSISLVKTLIEFGANPYKKLQSDSLNALGAALRGHKEGILIANFYIDSFDFNLFEPMLFVTREPNKEIVPYYIQDILVDKYLFDKLKNNEKFLKEYSGFDKEIDTKYHSKIMLMKKLKKLGVDFENHCYVKWTWQ